MKKLPFFLLITFSLFFLGAFLPRSKGKIRVEITAIDTQGQKALKIKRIEFDGEVLPLQPPDPANNRGSFYFQKDPGTYTLTWEVENMDAPWPKLQSYNKQIRLHSDDKWVYLTIEGDQMMIN